MVVWFILLPETNCIRQSEVLQPEILTAEHLVRKSPDLKFRSSKIFGLGHINSWKIGLQDHNFLKI